MSELLSRLEPSHVIPIVAIGGGILWGIINSLAMAWVKVRKAELQAGLNGTWWDKAAQPKKSSEFLPLAPAKPRSAAASIASSGTRCPRVLSVSRGGGQ